MSKHDPYSNYGSCLRSSFRLRLFTRISNEVGQNRQRNYPLPLNDAMAKLRGDRCLSEVSNAEVRDRVEKMVAAGLSPKTIVNYNPGRQLGRRFGC